MPKYLKAAFLNHWNLLGFVSGTAFSFLTGRPDVVLPLVLAAETAYLGLLGTHPKFQKYVLAQEAKEARVSTEQANQAALQSILRSLPPEPLRRFKTLRRQCQELREMAQQLRHTGQLDSVQPLEGFQISGLDRLLWIYLRLLYTQFTLARFLERTGERGILADIRRLEERIAELPPAEPDSQAERVRKALEDNLETSRLRLSNLQKARDNHELVELEIDRLESKIRSVSEMAINRHEPDFISSQVDHVAASMLQAERTMNELQFATGLEALDDRAPELLESKAVQLQR